MYPMIFLLYRLGTIFPPTEATYVDPAVEIAVDAALENGKIAPFVFPCLEDQRKENPPIIIVSEICMSDPACSFTDGFGTPCMPKLT
jgi:hypothetical protein